MVQQTNMVPGTYNEVYTLTGNISTAVFISDGEPIFSMCRADVGDWKCKINQFAAMEMFQFFEWLQTEEAISKLFVKDSTGWSIDLYRDDVAEIRTMAGVNAKTITVEVTPNVDKYGDPYYPTKIAWPDENNALEDIIIDFTFHQLKMLSTMLLLFISNCPMYHGLITNYISEKIGDWVASGSKDTFQTYLHNHQQKATDFLRHSSDPC